VQVTEGDGIAWAAYSLTADRRAAFYRRANVGLSKKDTLQKIDEETLYKPCW
jgi:hypothetical protein